MAQDNAVSHQRRAQQQQERTPGPCRICGIHGPEDVPLPNRLLPEELNLPINNCDDLQTTALVVDDSSQLCNLAQSLAAYCGCNTAPDACPLCWDGSSVTNPDTILSNYSVSAFLGGLGGDVVLSCAMLQGLLQSVVQESSEQCWSAQLDVGDQCGCSPIPTNIIQNRTNTTSSQGTNGTTSDQSTGETDVPSCTLCSNGEPSPFPDRRIRVSSAPPLSCAEWDVFASNFPEGSEDCEIPRLLSRVCGCERDPDECNLCPLG